MSYLILMKLLLVFLKAATFTLPLLFILLTSNLPQVILFYFFVRL